MNAALNYTPEQGSLAWKVIQFLTTNPEELLKAEDVSAKFDVTVRGVHSAMSSAVMCGILTRTEDLSDGELVYRLGTGHPSVPASTAAAPSLLHNATGTAFPTRQPARQKRQRTVIDIDAIKLETDVPLPMSFDYCPKSKWPTLFARMSIGQSFVVPAASISAVSKAMTTYRKANEGVKMARRALDDDTIRVWRIK